MQLAWDDNHNYFKLITKIKWTYIKFCIWVKKTVRNDFKVIQRQNFNEGHSVIMKMDKWYIFWKLSSSRSQIIDDRFWIDPVKKLGGLRVRECLSGWELIGIQSKFWVIKIPTYWEYQETPINQILLQFSRNKISKIVYHVYGSHFLIH